MSQTPYYITTAISYVNGKPHLGHAYESILSDVMARFKRLDGFYTYFLTGTDEHGQKVAKTADDNGMDVKAFADQNADHFRAMTKNLCLTNDDFIRTTEPRHYKAAQALWEKLKAKGDIYLDKYEGWYSVREEAYFGEDELIIGDRGEKLSPNGTDVQWVEEGSYFFKLSAYTDKLLKYYQDHPEFIQPDSRRNEVMSFVKGGLNDLSVSRLAERLHWGIPVPDDEDHVMYVWLDALTNYMTGVGYPDTDGDMFKKFWGADVHVIGKDITRFHAVYWPAFLMSADLPLPKQIFAHGFINVAGEKMSKSIGNVLSPDDLVNTFTLDGMRYVLMRDMPHGQDGNFTDAHAIQRINADLANGLGNLAQRTFSMIFKNCDGKLPEPGAFNALDEALLNKAYVEILPKIRAHAESFAFHRALEDMAELVSECDAYVDLQAPWALKKTDPERMKTVLYVLAEMTRMLGILYQPYTPNAMDQLLGYLQIDDRQFDALTPEYALKPGLDMPKPEGVFPRIVIEEAA